MGQAIVEQISMKNKSVKLSTEDNWIGLDGLAAQFLGRIRKNEMVYYRKESGKITFITHNLKRMKSVHSKVAQEEIPSVNRDLVKETTRHSAENTSKDAASEQQGVENELLAHLDTLSMRLARIEKKLGVNA